MFYEVNVLVNGRKVDIYNDPNAIKDLYIEGREGSEYQIELVNNTWTDAEFVVSVDGLSIINGKPAGRDSEGYIVRARSSSRIPGWLVDEKTAAKFTFAASNKSYSAESGQGEDNTGVIGALVFKKLHRPVIFRNYDNIIPYYGGPTEWTSSFNTSDLGVFGSAQATNTSEQPRGMSFSVSNAGPELSSFSQPDEISSLGTGFGQATEMKTTKVSFERESNIPAFEQILHYATSKELNKLGIVLKWQVIEEKRKPNPFPADYCTPPLGWRDGR